MAGQAAKGTVRVIPRGCRLLGKRQRREVAAFGTPTRTERRDNPVFRICELFEGVAAFFDAGGGRPGLCFPDQTASQLIPRQAIARRSKATDDGKTDISFIRNP